MSHMLQQFNANEITRCFLLSCMYVWFSTFLTAQQSVMTGWTHALYEVV